MFIFSVESESEIAKTSSGDVEKTDLNWKLHISNVSRKVVGATSNDGWRLSWSEWLVTYHDGVAYPRTHPMPQLTGLAVQYLH